MLPTVEGIKTELKRISQMHGLDPSTVRTNVQPVLASPFQAGYNNEAKCRCGLLFSVATKSSPAMMEGAQEFGLALQHELSEHLLTSLAVGILKLQSAVTV